MKNLASDSDKKLKIGLKIERRILLFTLESSILPAIYLPGK